MPKRSRNRWDLDKCCRWIRNYETQLFEEQLQTSAREQWEVRLAELKYEKERDALLLRRRELIRIPELKPLLERVANGFKINFQGMGKREAPQIAAAIAKQLNLSNEQTQAIVPMISNRIDTTTRTSLQAFSDGIARLGPVRGSIMRRKKARRKA